MAEENQGITFESGQIPTYEEFVGRYQPDFKSYLGREQKEDFAKQQYDTFVAQAQETGDTESAYQQTIEGLRGSEEYQMYVDQGLIDAETGQYISEPPPPPPVMDISGVPEEELNELVQFVPEGYGSNQIFQRLNQAFVNELGRPVGKEGARHWTGELRRLMEEEGKTFDEASNAIGESIANSPESKAFKETGLAVNVSSDNQITGLPYGGTPISSVTAGSPSYVGEANVADVMGLQAVDPQFTGDTELETKIEEIDAEAEGTEAQDIYEKPLDSEVFERIVQIQSELGVDTPEALQRIAEEAVAYGVSADQIARALDYNVTADQITEMATEIGVTLPEERESTKVSTEDTFVATPDDVTANVVTKPTAKDAVTGVAQTTDLVDQPELAKMTAEKSYQQINQEADALQAARLELSEIDPKATVQGQLAILNEQFADGNVPVWAQGALKTANTLMAQRGLGNSSIAAESITNALMQSTLPIAQQDASFYQAVTTQNLANEQQAEMEKFNARVNAIFNDQAAENAARQLNTSSENELNQFFSNLSQQVALSNTEQVNAMDQFNATAKNQMTQFFEELGLTAETFNADALNEMATFNAEQQNIVNQFNASIKNQREQFNINNQLAIDASNIQWRRTVNTQNTAATNAALQFDVTNLLGLQTNALNNIWNQYDSLLNFAFQAEESALERAANIALATLNSEMQAQLAEDQSSMDLITTIIGGGTRILSSESGMNTVKDWWDRLT